MSELKKITAKDLLVELNNLHLENKVGSINFDMAGVSVKINTTDIVGNVLQAWLKQYFLKKGYYFREQSNTQEFPDFFLGKTDTENLLEIKSFNFSRTPAFDIANFESYCDAVKKNVKILDTDYMIFGYEMSDNGNVSIKKIWLHKIWEIAGKSEQYPLKTQIKRGMIYNIRPAVAFKNGKEKAFLSKEAFLQAIYLTLVKYKSHTVADSWKKEVSENYKKTYGIPLKI